MKARGGFIDDEALVVAEELHPTPGGLSLLVRGAGYPVGHADQAGPASGDQRSRRCDERSATANRRNTHGAPPKPPKTLNPR